jgi:hypothetical protein
MVCMFEWLNNGLALRNDAESVCEKIKLGAILGTCFIRT